MRVPFRWCGWACGISGKGDDGETEDMSEGFKRKVGSGGDVGVNEGG